ncbi:MAG: glycosyltransferase [Acidimicrobiia bacterium]|nr:glycosyltransferase [Acidimicrobiia bacterium]
MSRLGARATVGALVVTASAGHVLYPAWLRFVARRREVVAPLDPTSWPPLSVVVPAYREARVIGAKVEDLRSNGYRGELEILVVADGDPATAAAAEAAGACALTGPERLGKSQALNSGVAAASHELVVLTDANNRLAPGSLAKLVRWFADPGVGAVAGEKVEDDGAEQLYWSFESWLKRREVETGTTIGLIGELAAVRSAAWRPIPVDVAIDDLWIALDLCDRGEAIAYEPEARAFEPPGDSLRFQWQRRTRNVAGALRVLWDRRAQLRPRRGGVAGQIWGHRLWRYTGGPAAHLALLGVAGSRARTSRLARAFLGGHLVGALALAGAAANRSMPAPLPAAGEILFLQAVAIGGWLRLARNEQVVRWPKVDR